MKIEIDDKDIEELLVTLLKKHIAEWKRFIRMEKA